MFNYHLACFLLHNLVVAGMITWRQAEEARRTLEQDYEVLSDGHAWDGHRPDDPAHHPISQLLRCKIQCEFCGQWYGHRVWHSTSPGARDTWECLTSHQRRNSCPPGWIRQEDLLALLLQGMQSFLAAHPEITQDVHTILATSPGGSRHLPSPARLAEAAMGESAVLARWICSPSCGRQ